MPSCTRCLPPSMLLNCIHCTSDGICRLRITPYDAVQARIHLLDIFVVPALAFAGRVDVVFCAFPVFHRTTLPARMSAKLSSMSFIRLASPSMSIVSTTLHGRGRMAPAFTGDSGSALAAPLVFSNEVIYCRPRRLVWARRQPWAKHAIPDVHERRTAGGHIKSPIASEVLLRVQIQGMSSGPLPN